MIVPTEPILLPSLKARLGANGATVLTQTYLDAALARCCFGTPHSVHYGQAQAMRVVRQATLNAAFAATPKRFKGIAPT
jgi:hypothetical protein